MGTWLERGTLALLKLSTWSVYCLGVPSGAKKIGVTNGDVRLRLSSLQTGNHEPISIIDAMYVPEDGALEIEKETHRRLADCRIHGEWFNCTTEDALSEMETAYTSFIRRWWSFYLTNIGYSHLPFISPIWHERDVKVIDGEHSIKRNKQVVATETVESQPWIAEGISRTTYFRRRAKSAT